MTNMISEILQNPYWDGCKKADEMMKWTKQEIQDCYDEMELHYKNKK